MSTPTTSPPQEPPPPDHHLHGFRNSNEHFSASAHINPDGRINISITDKASKLTTYLLKRTRPTHHNKHPLGVDLTPQNRTHPFNYQTFLGKAPQVPRLNIAIHIVGSRGDVQPFIAIAKELLSPPYNHRVRICTHPVFKDFVEENGVEFFSIGGDPATLMAYMVKNPGLMPGMESLKAGDVGKRRNDIAEIIEGCWRGCVEPGDGMGGSGRGEGKGKLGKEDEVDRLFIADAIIANPPSYAHIHCAEKLGIPLHMMFTMPWSPTQYFPHPLASLDRNEADPNFANYISYTMMELLAWQGLGDVINGFRVKTLHLDPISPLWGHMLLSRMKVPFTYCWSSELIPKPPDWGSYINISGFSFLDQTKTYTPPSDLMSFLNAGPPPVYIGFGSIVVDDPNKLTDMIFSAVKKAGVRALVSKGWGGLGVGSLPSNIFLLGNVPHDWLFQYVSAVAHHGGAGTTAIGIAMGRPTVVVPFFGDQPFWGAMIHRAGAGPEPVPFKKMTDDSLAASITAALEPDVKEAVGRMSEVIKRENGARTAAKLFHESVNLDSMRCLIRPDHVAVWRLKGTNVRLGAMAASVLLDAEIIRLPNLKLIRHRDWYVDEGAGDPIQGFVAAASGTVTNSLKLIIDYTTTLHRTLHTPSSSLPSSKNDTSTSTSLDVPDPRPEALRTRSLEYVPTRNPVQKAANFSPEHLDYVALKMASKTLKSTTDKQRNRRTYSWSPVQRQATVLQRGSEKRVRYHGRWHDAGVETGHFAYAMGATVLRIPVSLFYNLANGFHNAPSFLLSDPTVRRRPPITGFGSGLSASTSEITHSLLDSITGLYTLPSHGYTTSGPLGLVKGVGQSIAAIPLKLTAGVLGMPGYTLKGLERQLEKRYSRGLKASLLVVRIKQGILAFERATEEERGEVWKRWSEVGGMNPY